MYVALGPRMDVFLYSYMALNRFSLERELFTADGALSPTSSYATYLGCAYLDKD